MLIKKKTLRASHNISHFHVKTDKGWHNSIDPAVSRPGTVPESLIYWWWPINEDVDKDSCQFWIASNLTRESKYFLNMYLWNWVWKWLCLINWAIFTVKLWHESRNTETQMLWKNIILKFCSLFVLYVMLIVHRLSAFRITPQVLTLIWSYLHKMKTLKTYLNWPLLN